MKAKNRGQAAVSPCLAGVALVVFLFAPAACSKKENPPPSLVSIPATNHEMELPRLAQNTLYLTNRPAPPPAPDLGFEESSPGPHSGKEKGPSSSVQIDAGD